MTAVDAFLLGTIQGLSEFLPISSSGHLVVTPWLFGFDDPGLAFDVALHAGTLIAVVAYFWRDWLNIVQSGLHLPTHQSRPEYHPSFLWFIVLGTLPGMIAGFFLETLAETTLRAPLLVAGMLALGGLLLWLTDRYFSTQRSLDSMRYRSSFSIGLAQALALIPGVSRAGITMTAARAFGFDRVSAARFSFLLATPIIFGATLLKLPELARFADQPDFWIGVVVSAMSGFLAIRYLLRFLTRRGFAIFFWYRLALAGLIVLLSLGRGFIP